ncbi:hypothetical protein H6G00_01235 [Leptolyngbya sp. FACHB-541]|uniref:hypothetical protein n=1 Tax=Leptolyngbya sp. FACHB-541 TaxID=2692810 RepID=UPI0016879916|nr:hypothetical protein [Leptolyngbya sp. FACHB-541]MBD1995253.1 hypothetical protein [Leptolyngbya sp. FACHB-541]
MKFLTNFVLVYPPGQLPPDVRPEDIPDDVKMDEASMHFEDYVFWFSDAPPVVGDKHSLNSNQWSVAQIHSYQVSHTTPGPVQTVFTAVCSQDGSVPERREWYDSNPVILYIPALTNGKLALNDDGTNRFGLVDNVVNIPFNEPFEDWEFKYCQSFDPVGRITPQGFEQIVLCWCRREESPAEKQIEELTPV